MPDPRLKYADNITLDRIKTLHPDIRERVLEDYLAINMRLPHGIRLRFSEAYRDSSYQAGLYAKGRTKPGKIVTNAKPGQSIHEYGLAFDIVLLYDRDKNGTYESASWSESEDFDKNGKRDWFEVVDFFKAQGYKWGGSFKSIYDSPHFELTFGNTWRTLQRKRKVKDKTNGLLYPVLN